MLCNVHLRPRRVRKKKKEVIEMSSFRKYFLKRMKLKLISSKTEVRG